MRDEIVARSLTSVEQSDLAELEGVIRKHLRGFVLVGNALSEIRERKLYRTEFSTFRDYCREVWEIGRSRAYQLMDVADVIENLSTIVDKNEVEPEPFLPVNEAQARPLTILKAEDQIVVWRLVKNAVLRGPAPLTARLVSQQVEDFLIRRALKEVARASEKRKNLKNGNTKQISEEMDRSFKSFLLSVENEIKNGWQQTNKKEVADCLHAILAAIGE